MRLKLIETGTTMKHLNCGDMLEFQLPLPPRQEQTAIANALSDMDALIAQTEKLIEKKKAIKQGAMHELLKPKEGWVTKKLGELLKYEQPTAYIVTDTEYHPNNETPVLTAGKSFILGYTNETNNIFENTPVVIFDDFTTSCQYVDFRFKVKSSAMKILKPANDNVNMRFAFEVLKSIKYQVGDHKRHWIGEFINFEVIIPSKIEEQNRIGQIIEDIEKEQQSYQVKLTKLKQQKQGMMQALLTGKIRLVS
jgi:type I restriction enzyme S subunit